MKLPHYSFIRSCQIDLFKLLEEIGQGDKLVNDSRDYYRIWRWFEEYSLVSGMFDNIISIREKIVYVKEHKQGFVSIDLAIRRVEWIR